MLYRALQAPAFAKAVVLVDGSQFSPAMEPVLKSRLATEDGYVAFTAGLFRDMFGARSDKAVAAAIIDRASRLPWPVGEKMLNDMLRYDVWRLTASLASVRVPVMALQTTYSNERRERVSMRLGQTTPYLDMLRETVAAVRIDVIEDTGHFPQIEESARTNALIESFVASLYGSVQDSNSQASADAPARDWISASSAASSAAGPSCTTTP
jgi:pimeloyl-ACP methyl ester carboxylesterase